jgi:hypothetical protein
MQPMDGEGSVAVVDGTIYLTDVGTRALDAADSSELWSTPHGSYYTFVTDRFVYVTEGVETCLALDRTDGSMKVGTIEVPAGPERRSSSLVPELRHCRVDLIAVLLGTIRDDRPAGTIHRERADDVREQDVAGVGAVEFVPLSAVNTGKHD